MRNVFRHFVMLVASVAVSAGQGTWTTVAPMPTARENFGTVRTPDGLIYTVGGDAFNGTYVPTSVLEVYDPASNTWSSRAPMPTARYSLSAAYSNGKIYAFGGYNFGPRNAVEAYDPSTNTWSSMAPMPSARHGIRAVTGIDGKIYVIGGDVGGGGANVATLEIYDPVTNSWTIGPSMPNVKIGPGAALGNDGQIYVMGGGQSGIRVASMFAYNPVSASWSVKSSMAVSRSGLAAATLPDGRIAALGGDTSIFGDVTGALELYDTNTDSWTSGTAMPTPRANIGLATGLDGRLYAVGGWEPLPSSLRPLSVNEVYTPATTVQFQICLLYDPAKAVKSGATIPLKFQLCNSLSENLSSSSLTVHATSLIRTSNETSVDIQDPGSSNPDNDFRFDPSLGGTGGYIFNLKTTGLQSGTYKLSFTVGTNGTVYSLQFQVK